MHDRYPPAAILLSVFALITLRQALGGPPLFLGEFVLEDLVMLLALATGFAPDRLKPLLWRTTVFAFTATMSALAWIVGSDRLSFAQTICGTLLFTLLAVWSGTLTIRELFGHFARKPGD